MGMSYEELRQRLREELRRQNALPPEPEREPDPLLAGMEKALQAPVVGGVLQGTLGLLGALGEAPVVGGVLQGLSYPGEVLRGVALRHQLAGDTTLPGPLGTLQSVQMGIGDLARDTLAYGPLGALGHARDVYRELPLTGAGFLADLVLDPLNLAGFGIPGRVAARLPAGSRLRGILGKAQAAEDAASRAIARGVEAGVERGGALLRVLPGVGKLFQPSARRAVAVENDRIVNFLGHLANLLETDNTARWLADLYHPAGPGAPDAQQARALLRSRLDELGLRGLPEGELEATIFSAVPGFDPEVVQRFVRRLPQDLNQYDRDRALVLEVLARHYPAGAPQPRSTQEALRFIERRGAPEDAALLREIVRRWRGTDLLRDTEDHALTVRYLRRYAREQGLGDPFKLGDIRWIRESGLPDAIKEFEPGSAWRELLTAWRQQALFWPSYFLNNLADIELKSRLVYGIPGTVDLRHNLAGLVGRIAEEHPQLAGALRKALGDQPYQRLAQAGSVMGPVWQAFAEQIGLRHVPAEILQAGIKNEIGGVKAPTFREPMGLERLPKVGELFQRARELTETIELSARSAAFMDGYRRAMQARAQDLGRLLGGALAHRGYDPAALVADIEANQGLISAQRVLQHAQAVGADAQTQAQLLREFGRVQSEAYHAGVQAGFKIHFDYRDTTNLDELLRNLVGFHFWATRNVPLYFEIMATHPGVWASLRRLDERSAQYREAVGDRSPRLRDTVPLGGLGRQLAETLFGVPGEVYGDPRRLVTITDAPGGDVSVPAKGETPLGRALDVVRSFGISPHPFAQAPLEILGVYGARQPGPVLRATPLINAAVQAATGEQFDLEAPIRTLRRQRLSGPPPAPPEVLVRARLREMSQERYGRPDAPEFQRAQAEGPTNPLWREAVRSLGSRSLREQLTAMVGVPLRVATDAERELARRKQERHG